MMFLFRLVSFDAFDSVSVLVVIFCLCLLDFISLILKLHSLIGLYLNTLSLAGSKSQKGG